ncbi:MAG TPA: tRNA pseudouridine(55) synthase TruB [Gemmatimonadales bacterium]|nr:tRNA pseudouridine(55) synthase TruB [Gemmatimonadales bacterium]
MIDKPAGPTSHDVVARVRRALGTRAVGHTGTLDPFATGLLVVMVGRATRLARFVEQQPKTYLATVRLGRRTTTDDPTGEPLGEDADPSGLGEDTIRDALARRVGPQEQRPPAYSAKRVAGARSYHLARKGIAVDLPPVPVTVHQLRLVAYRPPELVVRARVSPGTYLRALARDLGEDLGVGAHLVALRREAVGELRVDGAIPLDRLRPDTPLLPPQAVLRHLPAREIDAEARRAVAHGRPLPGAAEPEGPVVLMNEGDLVAVAMAEGGWLKPAVVLERT